MSIILKSIIALTNVIKYGVAVPKHAPIGIEIVRSTNKDRLGGY